MTKDEATARSAMKLALDALVYASSYCDTYDAITALREALAEQPAQQEPVAGKKSRTSADNYGASYETSDRAPFTDGDPSDGY